MSAPTVLRDVRVFDGERLTEPTSVVIDGPVIGADDTGATSVQTGGATLLPGLIDSHVHLRGWENLDQLAQWGVTTTLDMGCWPAERVAELRRNVGGRCDFRTAGLPAIGPGGPHSRMPGMPREAIILTENEARSHVARQVALGVDYIKAVAEAPGAGGPSLDALSAVVNAARDRGLATVVHAASVGAYTLAVESRADFVTHAPVVGRIDTRDIATLAVEHRKTIPTAIMMTSIINSGALGERGNLRDPLSSISALHNNGIPILAGTDANSAPGSPSHIPHGQSLHDELELLVQAGMSTVEALRAATSSPAQLFGLTDRGSVRPGMRADLVLVDGDPLADIRATRAIRAVWCAGIPIRRTLPDLEELS